MIKTAIALVALLGVVSYISPSIINLTDVSTAADIASELKQFDGLPAAYVNTVIPNMHELQSDAKAKFKNDLSVAAEYLKRE